MDVIQLIESIKKHVFLYDINHEMYKNLGLKTCTWDSIAEELNQTSDAVRLKWKTIRDGYLKYKKQLKNAAASKTFTKVPDYIWGHHLRFLDAYQVYRKPNKPNKPSRATLKTYTTVDSHASTTQVVMPPLQPISSTSASFLLVEPVQQRAQKRVHEHEIEAETATKQIKTIEHDAVDYLFLSYAQTFKKFSLRQQATMKMELANMFSRAELAELDTSEFETTHEFSFVKTEMTSEGVRDAASPAQSNHSSSYSNCEQISQGSDINSIKEEIEEHAFAEDFQEHIVP